MNSNVENIPTEIDIIAISQCEDGNYQSWNLSNVEESFVNPE